MLPAACLVISFFPSTAPYLLLWQLNATRGANEIPSHIEIQITHQLDEQANVEYIGTVTDWGMEVHAVDLFAVSVINYPLLARQPEQNRTDRRRRR